MSTTTRGPAEPRTGARSALALVGFIVLCQAAGASGAVVTDASWYRALDTPPWAPPGWIFGPVWISLYTVMGIAAWLVWRSPAGRPRQVALIAFGVQLALNAAWTPIFFGLRSVSGGLAVIVLLLGAIVATIVCFRRCRPVAAWLLAPYLAWVSFATALNGAIWLRM